jgi:hypothetical protein
VCKDLSIYYSLWINDLQDADKYIAEWEQRENAEKSHQTTNPVLYFQTKYLRALFFAKLGKKDQAIAIARDLKPSPLISVYAELGMAHEVVQLLQEKIKTNKLYFVSNYYQMQYGPFYERIRNDPEFQKLLRQQKPVYDELVRKYRIK